MMDYHLHTDFSTDGKQTMDELCLTARAKGIKNLAITDHVDLPDPRFTRTVFNIDDPEGYVAAVDKTRIDYPDISIVRGLELGYTPSGWPLTPGILERIKPEFVIGSLHLADGLDPYEARYFEGRSKREAYRQYFEALLAAMSSLLRVCKVLGHLTYVSKFAPAEYGELCWSDEPDAIDAILQAAVDGGMVLEVNSSGYRRGPFPLPGYSIIRRYREMGGEFVTLGSDAHRPGDVGARLGDASNVARLAGIRYALIMERGEWLPVSLPG